MNRKARAGIIIISLIVIIILIILLMMNNNTDIELQSGVSTDYAYTVETGKLSGWNKLWLKDDHTTVYCFNDERMFDIIKKAKADNVKIDVYYSEYIFRGSLCSSGSDKIKSVVVTNIKISEGQ